LRNQVWLADRPPPGCVQLNNDEALLCAQALERVAPAADNTSNLVRLLRDVEKQLDRYREALIEAQDGLDEQADPDDVRTRIYLALRGSEYTGDRLRSEIGRLGSQSETKAQRPAGWVGHPSVADPAVTHDGFASDCLTCGHVHTLYAVECA